MKMTEISKKAKALGLKTKGLNKSNMIRAVQTAEGNAACFATGRETCDQITCCWREDCLPAEIGKQK